MLELFQAKNAVCVQKVQIVLVEKALRWTPREIDFFAGGNLSREYLAVNPNGVVPTLIHNGRPIRESSLICEYLDDEFPDKKLVPSDPYIRFRMRLWSKIVDESLHEGISAISFAAMFRGQLAAMPEKLRNQRIRNVGDLKRRARYESTLELGIESPHVVQAIAAYETAFERMETELGSGGDWLLGEHFSLADVNLIPYVARLHFMNIADLWLENRPNIQAWWQRASSRDSVQVVIRAPLAGGDIEEMASSGTAARDNIQRIRQRYVSDVSYAA